MNIVIAGSARSGKTIVASNIYEAMKSKGSDVAIINLSRYNSYDDYFGDALIKIPLVEVFKRPEELDAIARKIDLVEIKKESNYIYYSSVFNSEAFSYENVHEKLQRIVTAFNTAGKSVIIEVESELLSSGTFAAFLLSDRIYYVMDESIESFKNYHMSEDLLIGYQDKTKVIITHYKNKLELSSRLDIILQLPTVKLSDMSYTTRKLARKIEIFVDEEQLLEGEKNNDFNRNVFKWSWTRNRSRKRKETRDSRGQRESISKSTGENERYNL